MSIEIIKLLYLHNKTFFKLRILYYDSCVFQVQMYLKKSKKSHLFWAKKLFLTFGFFLKILVTVGRIFLCYYEHGTLEIFNLKILDQGWHSSLLFFGGSHRRSSKEKKYYSSPKIIVAYLKKFRKSRNALWKTCKYFICIIEIFPLYIFLLICNSDVLQVRIYLKK